MTAKFNSNKLIALILLVISVCTIVIVALLVNLRFQKQLPAILYTKEEVALLLTDKDVYRYLSDSKFEYKFKKEKYIKSTFNFKNTDYQFVAKYLGEQLNLHYYYLYYATSIKDNKIPTNLNTLEEVQFEVSNLTFWQYIR